MSVISAFEKFMASGDFKPAVDSATKASWGGSGYSVELFDDGSYRILWDNQIGNLYDSPGLILSIPSLTDEEWDEDEDPSIRFYHNAEQEIRDAFYQHYQANLNVQAVIADGLNI